MLKNTLAAVAALAVTACPLLAGLPMTGVNLAGAEFGNVPGTHGHDYSYPLAGEVDYFKSKGFSTIRLPFRWERLQPTLGAAFDAAELNRLDTFVTQATSRGATVILDPHNYARYNGTIIGTGSVTNAHFSDMWSKLATRYQSNSKVVFGLVNEPYGVPSTEHWVNTANTAIAAIRNTGAKNMILVPGNFWTGAYSWNTEGWYGTSNGVAMKNIVDPGNNFAFEVHQYLDDNSAGDSFDIVSPTIGRDRLIGFTNWLKQNNYRGFLGEFAVDNATIGTGSGQIGDEAIHNMLNYMEANADVWLGWSWWAAGPRWGNYEFSIEPTNLGQPNQADKPAMAVLAAHATVPEPTLLATVALAAGALLRRPRGRKS